MLASRLFWKLLSAYAGLSFLAALFFITIQTGRQREMILEQMRQRLHDSAVLLRSQTDAAFNSGASRELQVELQQLSAQTGTRLTLIDDAGVVIGDSDSDPATMDNHRNRDELVQARSLGYGISMRSSTTLEEPMMYYALDAGRQNGFVRVALPMASVNREVAVITQLVWGTAIGVSLTAFVVTYFLFGRIIRPLETLTAATQAIAAGDFKQQVHISNRDEIGKLADTFNLMSRELDSRIDQLQVKQGELEANAKLLETVLGSMIEGVVVVDARQHVLFANRAARRLLDFVKADFEGRPIWEAARHPMVQSVVKCVFETAEQRREEFEVSRTQLIVDLLGIRLPGDPCPGAVLVIHDVTELRRLENLRREFVSNVSHELKTPLTSIKAYTETLLDGAVDDPEHNRVFLQRIEEQAERLHLQILDLLSLGRIESEQHAFDVCPVKLAATVTDCVDAHRKVAESKGVLLSTEPGDGDVRVLADPEGLRTILDNLVDNALNYTPAGQSVSVTWTTEDEMVVVSVTDTGPGIAEKHLVRIFERFYRVDKARSRELGGTGLGLAIVKHLTQVFGGEIDVTSVVGRGSKFAIRLPMALPA